MLRNLERSIASRAADERSVPIRLTGSTLHFRRLKSEQQHKRNGFNLAAPSTCAFTGWNWGVASLESWKSLTLADPNREGDIVSDTAKKKIFTNAACIALAHEALQPIVNNTKLLTAYSWRRMPSTLSVAIGLTAQKMLNPGDWQDKTLAGMAAQKATVAAVPLRHAANKKAESVRVKHLAGGIPAKIEGYDNWNTIPPSERTEAHTSAKVASQVDEAFATNETTMWQRKEHHDARALRKPNLKVSVEAAMAESPQTPGKLLSEVTLPLPELEVMASLRGGRNTSKPPRLVAPSKIYGAMNCLHHSIKVMATPLLLAPCGIHGAMKSTLPQ